MRPPSAARKPSTRELPPASSSTRPQGRPGRGRSSVAGGDRGAPANEPGAAGPVAGVPGRAVEGAARQRPDVVLAALAAAFEDNEAAAAASECRHGGRPGGGCPTGQSDPGQTA